jgi:hypothetical protein
VTLYSIAGEYKCFREKYQFLGPCEQAKGIEKSGMKVQGKELLPQKEVTDLSLERTLCHSFNTVIWMRKLYNVECLMTHHALKLYGGVLTF